MAGSSLLYYVGVVVLVCVRCDEDHQHFPSSFSTSSGQREKRSAETEKQRQSLSYWLEDGQSQLSQALLLEPNKRMAKNIILVIGDGMSLSTNTAGRIFKGQSQGRDGVSAELSWDQFPHIGQSFSLSHCEGVTVRGGNVQGYPRPITWTPWSRTAPPPPSACTAG